VSRVADANTRIRRRNALSSPPNRMFFCLRSTL